MIRSRRRSTRSRRSRSYGSKGSTKSNPVNKFFDKIFVINLYDNVKRWKEVIPQFKRLGVDVQRFVAVDGRCKASEAECIQKLKSFELAYDVEIPFKGKKARSVLPAASLAIGTVLLLRAMIRNNWKRILICEDDIHVVRGFMKKFEEILKEQKGRRWDLLYLGCGQECGVHDISEKRDRHHRYVSTWVENGDSDDEDIYVHHRDDLRMPCGDMCEEVTEHLTKVYNAGGTWCYAYSLTGAKKVLKAIGDNIDDHIDQILMKLQYDGTVTALAADPPLVMHEDMRGSRKSDIPW